MKKTISIAALVLMSSAALFANGNKDTQDSEFYGRGPMGGGRSAYGRGFQDGQYSRGFNGQAMGAWCYDEDGNLLEVAEITAEGTLVLEEGTLPYLNTADGKVFLMVPPFALDGVELEGGEELKVSGFDMPYDRWGNETDSPFIRVLTAEIDGKVLELNYNGMGRGARGGMGGMGGAYPRGPRFNG